MSTEKCSVYTADLAPKSEPWIRFAWLHEPKRFHTKERFVTSCGVTPRMLIRGLSLLEALVSKARGEEVPTWIDPTAATDNPLIVTKEWLDAHPDFQAEWEG